MGASSTSSKTPARKSGDVPDGHRRVQIAYSATDPQSVGSVVDLPTGEAAGLVDGGRARYVVASTPLGKPDGKPGLVDLGGDSVTDVTAASNDGPATAGQA